jgi:hypothetical protein
MTISQPEKRKKEILAPVLTEAGAAMVDCQRFEYGIALLLYHLGRFGVEGLDPSKVALILEDEDKRTAGQLIWMLKKYVEVSDGIEQVLSEALIARNRLMHRVFVDGGERLQTEEGRSSLVEEIRTLRSKVQKALEKVDPFITALNATLDGFDSNKLEDGLREKLS